MSDETKECWDSGSHNHYRVTIDDLRAQIASLRAALGEREKAIRDVAYPIEELRKHIVEEYPSPNGSLRIHGPMAAVIRWHQDEALAALSAPGGVGEK